jgi:NAD(P)-dependent dehydrogenase (short-subunit alcohol dehydrogenase family)
VALLARRVDRLDGAAAEAGDGTLAIACDVTDQSSVAAAIADAATGLGGIDGLVYTPGIGPLARIEDTDAAIWREVFDTNVIGASLVTAAALPHLQASDGTAVFLSSVSASLTPPWPGLGAYAVSKAALDKLIDSWRAEHPEVGFTRVVVGECSGGEGDSLTGFANGWDFDLAGQLVGDWMAKGYMSGVLMPVERLVSVVDLVLRSGAADSIPTVVAMPRPVPQAAPPADTHGAVGSEA